MKSIVRGPRPLKIENKNDKCKCILNTILPPKPKVNFQCGSKISLSNLTSRFNGIYRINRNRNRKFYEKGKIVLFFEKKVFGRKTSGWILLYKGKILFWQPSQNTECLQDEKWRNVRRRQILLFWTFFWTYI